MTSLSTESGGNINHEDYATVFVEFNGEWEYEDKEGIIFKNSESSTIFVPK
nr:hypothetical protein [Tanacetum cinerariifolium]